MCLVYSWRTFHICMLGKECSVNWLIQGDCAQLSIPIRLKVKSGSNQTQLSVSKVWYRKHIYADQKGKRNLICIVSFAWIKTLSSWEIYWKKVPPSKGNHRLRSEQNQIDMRFWSRRLPWIIWPLFSFTFSLFLLSTSIAFHPLRGRHEKSEKASASEFLKPWYFRTKCNF